MKIKIKNALVGLILMGLSSSVHAVEKTGAYGTASQDQPDVINLLKTEVNKILNNTESKIEKLGPFIEELKDKMSNHEQRLNVIKTVYDNWPIVKGMLCSLLTPDTSGIFEKVAEEEKEEFTKRGIVVGDSMNERRRPFVFMKAMKERMNLEFNKEHVRQLLGMLGLSGWHELDWLPKVINPIREKISIKEIIIHEDIEGRVMKRLRKLREGQSEYFMALEEDEFERGMIPYFWDKKTEAILEWLRIDPQRETADDEDDNYAGFFDKDVDGRDSWALGSIYGPWFVIRESSLECMKTHFLNKLFAEPQQDLHFYIMMRSPTYGHHTTSVDSTPQGIKFTDSHYDGAPRIMKTPDELMEALLASLYGVHKNSCYAPTPGWEADECTKLASMYGIDLLNTTADYYDTTKDLSYFHFFPKNEEGTTYEENIMKDCLEAVLSNQEPVTTTNKTCKVLIRKPCDKEVGVNQEQVSMFKPVQFDVAILPDGTWNAFQKYCEQPDRED